MRLPFDEQFLQHVWQYQYFNHHELKTTDGDSIEIIYAGTKNSDEGPDFINAKVKIGDLLWIGSVEIHLRSRGWNEHKHQQHMAYNSVILHVVYENNFSGDTLRNNHSVVPVIELKKLVSSNLIEKGNQLFFNISPIPCSNFLRNIDPVIFNSTLARVLTHRLERKSNMVLDMLEKNDNDWEETTYQLIAQHFGMKVNNHAFARLAENLPLKVLLKNSENLFSIEALLFGQAGFLEHTVEDDYHKKLKKEYLFLKHKYDLCFEMQIGEWKYLRLRPYNFPELRIAELAVLYHKNGHLHAQLTDFQDIKYIKNIFKTAVSDYWKNHYGFGKELQTKTNGIGDLALDNLIINVVATLLVAYGRYKNDVAWKERAFEILESIAPENNKIVRQWLDFGKEPKNAFESQAMLELFNTFCTHKACLGCQIGVNILGR